MDEDVNPPDRNPQGRKPGASGAFGARKPSGGTRAAHSGPGGRPRRAPKKVTLERLKRQALYYLERYSATSGSLGQVLRRKVMRAAREHPDTDMDQAQTWIDDIVAECVRIGLVNDANFALSRARSLLRGGKSQRAVAMALRQKGISAEDIDQAFDRLRDEQMPIDPEHHSDEVVSLDLEAARAYARKRRLGGLRQPIDHDRRDKDLAALARRGFSFDMSKRVLAETFEGQENEWD